MFKKITSLLSIITLSFFYSCDSDQKDYGTLYVNAIEDGNYEIFSYDGDSILQFVSERVGRFNKELKIPKGQYLILADCSHKRVQIYANQQTKLLAHQVEFVPPHAPEEGDIFSIQCNRDHKSRLKQQINNRYSFNMISETNDLLVGMLPLKIDLPFSEGMKPIKKVYKLAGVRMDHMSKTEEMLSTPYFVSPSKVYLSVTQPQTFGRWQFLLPGEYRLSLSGTEMKINLKAGEALSLKPAGLNIGTKEKVNLELIEQIRGNPLSVKLNGQYPLFLDVNYPLLPGQVTIKLDGSNQLLRINLEEDILNSLRLNSIQVDLGCSPWEWECLGRREVNLYLPTQDYPFMTGLSDMPILYPHNEIEVSVEGSKGMRYRLPQNTAKTNLKVGKLKIVPVPIYKPGLITDLMRVEAGNLPIVGYSHDVIPNKSTVLTLIEGRYKVSRYTSVAGENDRAEYKKNVVVKSNQITTVEVLYYLSENRMKRAVAMLNRKKRSSDLQLDRTVVRIE